MSDRLSPAESLSVDAPPDVEFEIAPHFNPDESASPERAVRAILAEHKALLDAHANLAWTDRMQVKAPNGFIIPTDKRVKKSGFDGRLAYMGPYAKVYYVQNRKIFLGKQKQIALSEVPQDAKIRERNTEGQWVEVLIHPRELVGLALAIMDQQLLASDPFRCKVCIDFRAESQIALMAHFRLKHPKELDDLVDGIEKLRLEAEEELLPPPPPPTSKPKKQSFRAASG